MSTTPVHWPVFRRPTRPGFSLLELQIAFVLFALALAGLCPLLVMQSKHIKKIEDRLSPQTVYYLTPSSDAWAIKLGVAAAISTTDPGAATAPPPGTLIDNGTSAYSELGTGWKAQTAKGAFNNDLRWHASGMGLNSASWQFSGLAPGSYKVEATWLASGNRATNAPYTIYDGLISRGTVTVNQKQAPVGDTYQGSNWSVLGTFPIAGNTVRVQLSDKANNRVIADAVRILAVPNGVQILSLDRSLTSEDMTAHVSVTLPGP